MLSSDLHLYKALANTSTPATNGGRMAGGTANRITHQAKNNLWLDRYSGELAAGSTVKRKVFCKVHDDADGTLVLPRIFLARPTPAGDYGYFQAAGQRDYEADVSGRIYTAGVLAADAAIGATSIEVTVEHTDLLAGFVDTDELWLSGDALPTVGGAEEYAIVSGVPTPSGLTLTIGLAAGLVKAYSAGDAVASVYKPGDIACSVDSEVATGLTYTADSITCDNIGTIEQTWTISGTSDFAFTCTGDTVGVLAEAGDIATEFAPVNPDWDKPYFKLSAGSITAIAAGNTLVFQTHPAAAGILETVVTPAGTARFASSSMRMVFRGEF